MENQNHARVLPEHPDLTQLRKQAKELKAAAPYPNLSQAHFAIAQEYGFPSWPKLVFAVRQRLFGAAIKDGDLAAFDNLVSQTPRLARTPFDDGQYPLHLAVWHDDPVMIRRLVAAGAKLDCQVAGSGHTPLSWAVTGWKRDIAQHLVELGSEPDLFCAAGLGMTEAVAAMLASGKRSLSRVGSSRYDAQGNRVPGPPTSRRDQISDGLYMACRNGHAETARLLLEAGADVNWRAFIGATPLHWAVLAGSKDCIDLLVENGASWTVRDEEFQATPAEFPGFVLVGWGFPDGQVLSYLASQPAAAAFQTPAGTLLHFAVLRDRPAVAKALVAAGADRQAKDSQGRTASQLAGELGLGWSP
ncbi:MAG: ankyrin repeat domain-containing protein [Fimbriimonadaceae bacterium]|nr:ankyrin repeat domain-containing protein [Fimbriimonadaceae bacterium]